MQQLRVPPEMFRFTQGDRADLYVSMLHAFGEANERLETSLGLDDVRARLRSVGWLDVLADDDLTGALGQLRQWNLIDVIQNHAEDYQTASEYERRNLQYFPDQARRGRSGRGDPRDHGAGLDGRAADGGARRHC
jgi:Protein of unknown function (DUF2397)